MAATAASPGNIVVPLSTILDQLRGKLSESEVNALLLALVSQRTREVRPGDLITAELFNQILSDVADLTARVAALEGSMGGHTDGLHISLVQPSGLITAGDTIRITGTGFGFTRGAHSVFFGSTRAQTFDSGSSDTLLIVHVPDVVAGATAAGAPITMTVGNGSEVVTWPLTIRSRPVQVGGALEFGYLGSTPASPAAGAEISYSFRLASLSNAALNVLITPDVQFPGVPSLQVEVHDSDGQLRPDRTIALAAGAARTISVRIASLPAAAPGTSFTVGVTAGADGVQTVSAVVPPQAIGVAGEVPDSTISNLTFNQVLDGTANFGPAAPGDTVDGTLSIPGSTPTRVTIALDATFANIAQGTTLHYTPSVAVVSGSGWSAGPNSLVTPSSYTVAGPGAQEFPGFDIDAPASGQALIRFTLTRQETSTNNKRSVTFRVQRG